MAFDQRDKFIQAIVVFTTSEQAQAMSLGDRQNLLLEIRDKYAPDISNEEWGEIAKGINDFKFVITDSVKNGEVPTIDSQLPVEEIGGAEEVQKPESNVPEPEDNSTDEINDDNEIESEEDISDPNDERYNEDEEIIDKEEGEADNLEEPELPVEEPVKEPETYGRVVKKDNSQKPKIDTSRLRGLMKPKKNG